MSSNPCVLPPGAGVGEVSAVIKDPQGNKNTVEALLEDKGDSVFRCTYRPVQAGPHTVTITFGGIGIPKSPFTVTIGPGTPRTVHLHLPYSRLHVDMGHRTVHLHLPYSRLILYVDMGPRTCAVNAPSSR